MPDFSTFKMLVDIEGDSATKWQERRHPDWTTNYMLYRDKVITNRLTQRQTINVPLMKQTLKTLLAKTDERPDVQFVNLSNDKQAELYLNEQWIQDCKENKVVIKDIVDKKQVFLYGRSFKKLNIINGRFKFTIEDPQDIDISRFADPTDIDGTHYFRHKHIFRRLADIELNSHYDKDMAAKLRTFFSSPAGVVKSSENEQSLREKNERMRLMGVMDVDDPRTGETVVELNEHYIRVYEDGIDQFYLVVTGITNEHNVLMATPLEDVIDPKRRCKDHFWRDHLPFSTWADDVERTDVWSDSIGDIVRQPNIILNSWMAQEVENRTLKNYGMRFYDATASSKTKGDPFVPQTFEAVAWGFYPLPGKPSDILMNVDIPDLTQSLDVMNYLMGLVEKATAATAITQGATEQRKVTLGEIQLAFANASERITSIAKFYDEGWEDFAYRYYKMLEAGADMLDAVELFKESYKGNVFSKTVAPTDFISPKGYRIKVVSRTEQEENQVNQIQRLDATKQAFPGNVPLEKIYQNRMLQIAKLNPEEMKEVMDFERKKEEQLMNGGIPADGATAANAPIADPSKFGANTQRLIASLGGQGGAAAPAMVAKQ